MRVTLCDACRALTFDSPCLLPRLCSAFWAGLDAKLFESATKGAILMCVHAAWPCGLRFAECRLRRYSKESINASLLASGTDPVLAGIAAGAGGGVCQVAVMGPCTFLVTGAVTSGSNMSTMERARQTWSKSGVKGFYPGGTALAFRQASDWASRQGFTEGVRERFKVLFHGDAKAKLTKAEEVGAGIVGGTLACWCGCMAARDCCCERARSRVVCAGTTRSRLLASRRRRARLQASLRFRCRV